jgi:hypothetical protein
MFVHETNHKGAVAELAIAESTVVTTWLSISAPASCVFSANVGALNGDVVQVHLTRNRRRAAGYLRDTYTVQEIDAVAVYCGDLGRSYLIPVHLVAGMQMLHLRLKPPRNGQRAALHWAALYELGAVAQWEERRRGTPEAGGSSPPSSTGSTTSPAELIEVGAHQFRNHFGYYMEQASGGQEILIRRRRRPLARLGPPQPPG